MKPFLCFTRIVIVPVFALAANFPSVAQTASTPASSGPASSSTDQSFTITTPPAAWTDTGLDLKAGDVVQISDLAITGCGPQANDSATQASSLPLPSAPAGSLLARLHAQGAAPLLVEAGKDIQIQEASHLFLGVNGGNCAGSVQGKVHVIPATSAAPATSTSTAPKDIKS